MVIEGECAHGPCSVESLLVYGFKRYHQFSRCVCWMSRAGYVVVTPDYYQHTADNYLSEACALVS